MVFPAVFGRRNILMRNGKLPLFKFDDGNAYDGEWRNDKMHGHGIMTRASGNRYEGDWRDDKRHGRGIYTWASKDR
jgi:hypothetical protein